MDCPVCGNAMITLELAEVEIDYCSDCGGIWLDRGELEMLLGDAEQAGELLRSFRPAKGCREKPRRCPICLKKMRKVLVGSAPAPVLIDKCVRADGLWFDKGELQTILNSAKLDKDSKIQKLLAEMFGETVSGGSEL
jgi:hypothetical protein